MLKNNFFFLYIKNKKTNYISNINKINVEAKNIIKTPFSNIKITFKNYNTLNYSNYYFNGIPIPKDIKIEQKDNKLFISWDIDNLYLYMKNIKYIITLWDNKTESKYESFNKNIIIHDYKIDTEYVIKSNATVN